MFQIRPFKPGDECDMLNVFADAITRTAAVDYSVAQIEAWLRNGPDTSEILARCQDGRRTLVAIGPDEHVKAFIDQEADGHIDFFYAHPDLRRTGVARGLYAELEDRARADRVERLYVEASETARRFFEKQGFKVAVRRDFQVDRVPIHNYRMEKQLSGPQAGR